MNVRMRDLRDNKRKTASFFKVERITHSLHRRSTQLSTSSIISSKECHQIHHAQYDHCFIDCDCHLSLLCLHLKEMVEFMDTGRVGRLVRGNVGDL